MIDEVNIRSMDVYKGLKPGTLHFDIYNETWDVLAGEIVTIEELLAALKDLGVI